MRPRAGDRTIEVITAGLGGERGAGFATHAIPKYGIALEIQSLVVVVEEDVLGPPLSVDKLSHSFVPYAIRRAPVADVRWAVTPLLYRVCSHM